MARRPKTPQFREGVRLSVRKDQLDKFSKMAGYTTRAALAKAMKMDEGNVSRVLAGNQLPGPVFIAAMTVAFPHLSIDDLFQVEHEQVAA